MFSTRTDTQLPSSRTALALLICLAVTGGAIGAADRGTAAAGDDPPAAALDVGPLPRSPELTEHRRLADRRAVVIGERAYSTWTEDGLYPAMGFHTRGEMGGIWSPPIKLLDGLWFGVDGQWLGDDVAASRFSSGWGYGRTDYAASDGVRVSRTDFVPDGRRAQLVGLTLRSDSDTTVPLEVAAHSELMATYPWGETTPSQLAVNADDTGSVDDSALVFREQAGADHPLGSHDWASCGREQPHTGVDRARTRLPWTPGPPGRLPGLRHA